jgi:ketosteroid isomerase-like protein
MSTQLSTYSPGVVADHPERSARDVVLAIYEAIAARDMAAFADLVDPDYQVVQPPWLPYGGTHSGLEAVGEMFRQVVRLFDVSRIELRSLTAEGERAWAHFVVPTRATGEEVLVAEEWSVVDGRARSVRVWFYDPAPLRLVPAAP